MADARKAPGLSGQNKNVTPVPVFDEETGYLYLHDGTHRQVYLRKDSKAVYLWWKRDKVEVRVTLDDLHSLFRGGDKTA